MRRLLVSLVLPALFAAQAARADMKIGYVDTQRAVQEVDEGKATIARLRGEADDARKKLEVQKSALQKMQQDYEKQSSVLSDDAKKKKQEEMQKAYVEMQQSAQELQDGFDKKQSAAMASISQRMLQVIAEISEREGLSFVIDKQALLYAPNAADVTNEVVRRYNDKFSTPSATDSKSTAKSGKK